MAGEQQIGVARGGDPPRHFVFFLREKRDHGVLKKTDRGLGNKLANTPYHSSYIILHRAKLGDGQCACKLKNMKYTMESERCASTSPHPNFKIISENTV